MLVEQPRLHTPALLIQAAPGVVGADVEERASNVDVSEISGALKQELLEQPSQLFGAFGDSVGDGKHVRSLGTGRDGVPLRGESTRARADGLSRLAESRGKVLPARSKVNLIVSRGR